MVYKTVHDGPKNRFQDSTSNQKLIRGQSNTPIVSGHVDVGNENKSNWTYFIYDSKYDEKILPHLPNSLTFMAYSPKP